MTPQDIDERLLALANAGVSVSIACGPSGPQKARFSVFLAFGGEETPLPFAASGVVHAIEIAERECKRCGWNCFL